MGKGSPSYETPPPYELPPPYPRPPQLVVPAAHELEDALSCPICLGLLLDPLIAACCQNNYCRQCLQTSLRNKPECPLCRASLVLENTLPNRALRNLLPHDIMSQEVEAAKAVATFRPTRLSHRAPTSCCLLMLFVFSTAGLIIVLPLRSGCLSASAALRGSGLALSSLAGCRWARQEAETEPDVITAVSDASTRGIAQGDLKYSTPEREPVRSPRTYFPLAEAGVLSRSSTHLPSVPADAPWRVAAVDARAIPHLRFAPTFALQPLAPAEGVGMAWRRTKGRSQPLGSQPHGPGQAEAMDRVQRSEFRGTDDDAPWQREAAAEAMERDDGLTTLLSIVPG
jgi:hypothetical protein